MAFYKMCDCGEKVVFERIMGYPDVCPVCGRRMERYNTYRDDEKPPEARVAPMSPTAGNDSGSVAAGNGGGNAAGQDFLQNSAQRGPEGNNGLGGSFGQAQNSGFAFQRGQEKQYVLRMQNGAEISIPPEGGIVGRTELGAEELAEYPSVSRQHLRVVPKRNVGVLIEDLSRYGTMVDGKRIEKNSVTRVTEGARITLCNVDVTLCQRS